MMEKSNLMILICSFIKYKKLLDNKHINTLLQNKIPWREKSKGGEGQSKWLAVLNSEHLIHSKTT